MKLCLQTETQSVYQHGVSVYQHTFQIIDYLKTGKIDNDWVIPEWLKTYRTQICSLLMPHSIIEEYTLYHDCGKPYCLIFDEKGHRHFPNHAEVSHQVWLKAGGSPQAAKLMKMDMMIHTMKAAEVEEFVSHPEAITLLLVSLAEIHSNAKMFGGIDSTSFKIKWNQINKRGKMICLKLFSKD